MIDDLLSLLRVVRFDTFNDALTLLVVHNEIFQGTFNNLIAPIFYDDLFS